MIVNLGQNPDKRRVHSVGTKLQTITKNGALLWAMRANRWLTPSECWASLGHPVTPELVAACKGAVSPFSRGIVAPATRTHHSQVSQAGDAMHVASIGGVLLVVLLRVGDVLGSRNPRSQEGNRDASSDSSRPDQADQFELSELLSAFKKRRVK